MNPLSVILLQPFWNRRERRLRSLWRLLGALVLFVGATLALAVPLELLGWVQMGALFSLLTSVLAVWAAGRWLDRRPFTDFGLHLDRRWWIDLGFGLLLGALLMAAIFAVEWAAGWISVEKTFAVTNPERSFLPAILSAALHFLAVGISEELLFRGYLLRNLSEGFKFPAIGARGAVVLAWVLSSLLFGFAHAANPNATVISTANIALAGIFLGVGYVLTGDLAIPIGVHITWNFFQGNVFGFPVSGSLTPFATFVAIDQGGPELWTGGPFGPEAGLIGIIAIVLGTVLTWLWIRRTHGQATVDAELARYEPIGPAHKANQEPMRET